MTEPQRLEGVPGRYWHRLKDGRIQCDVCPRYCRLNEGQRGLCFVRGRQDDRIVLTTYGRSSGLCVDPIEKKPLNHYLPGTPGLSFGTAGCNQSTYCQGRGQRIIGRDWYDITTWRLTADGRCGICSTAIPGLFEVHPGNWG